MKRVRVPILDSDVFFSNDEADTRAFVARFSADKSDMDICDRTRGLIYTVIDREGNHRRILCVFDGDLNTVVHESVHMAVRILDNCEIKTSKENHEILAYLTAWLTETMLKLFPIVPKKKKRNK
jgi:hypothetical protein